MTTRDNFPGKSDDSPPKLRSEIPNDLTPNSKSKQNDGALYGLIYDQVMTTVFFPD